jgi:3-oxoacyl-[acyl-carrier-protein] synthase II
MERRLVAGSIVWMAMERVVITGIGLVTPVGVGTLEPWHALLAGESGIGPITRFDATRFRARIAGEVKGWDGARWVEKKRLKEMDRFTEFALGAASLAAADASLGLSEEERPRAGCIVGVGMGGLPALERTKETLVAKGSEKVSPYTIPSIISNLAAGQVSIAHRLEGPSYCTTSACSSGAHAIGEASQWIRLGKADVMLAGGAEATISPVAIAGFEAMFALSRRNDAPQLASRPFDRGRDGFVCGEGAAILVLESLSRATRRGARIYAELTGYGASSDAYHITQPLPGHTGAQRAMRMALDDAKLAPDAVDYVNAHGTSTPAGDVEESRAIAAVFGAHATDKALWVSSTKSMMGHLLGAAGAVETAICALAIARESVPPTINLHDPDPECALDYVPNTARRRAVRHAMNNSFGFGGTNCALVVSRLSSVGS